MCSQVEALDYPAHGAARIAVRSREHVYIYILYIYIYIRAESPGVALGSVATNEVYLFWKDK